MKTYLLPDSENKTYYDCVIKQSETVPEFILKSAIMGLEELELEDAKKKAKVGDCMLFNFDGKLLPFQVVHKHENGDCVLASYYVSDSHIFDSKTNVWRDSELRKYMNEELPKKFDPELVKLIKPTVVHTDNYTTVDKFWIPSHEEIGYVDEKQMFKKNVGTMCFDYYKNEQTA